MKKWGILRSKEGKLIKDLKETTLSLRKLGKKYGASKQAIHAFSKKKGIKRKPKEHKEHQFKRCGLCQKLLNIAKKPHSEYISIHTILEETGEEWEKYRYHLQRLIKKGLVNQRFGRVRSKRVEKAYAIYFTKPLPIRTIGRKVGFKNFSAIISRYRQLGWNIPPSLYGKRRKIINSRRGELG